MQFNCKPSRDDDKVVLDSVSIAFRDKNYIWDNRQKDRQKDRQKNRQMGRQKDRRMGRQKDRRKDPCSFKIKIFQNIFIPYMLSEMSFSSLKAMFAPRRHSRNDSLIIKKFYNLSSTLGHHWQKIFFLVSNTLTRPVDK